MRRKRESINHDQRAIAIILTLLLLLTLTGVCAAQSEETGTTEEILNILKQRGIVTGEEYEDLKKKAEEEKKKEEKEYTVKWNNGINVDRNDGAFKVKIGGRIHLDWGDINPDSALKRNNRNGVYGNNELNGNGAEFRRARLYVDGTLWERFLFKAQYDFAGQDADFKDVYLGLRDIPFLGILRVGQMKEPISLEELTSSNYITFMERSLPVVAFAPSRKTGIEVNNTILNKRMTWGVGAFYGDTDDDGDSDFNNNTRADIAFRLTGLPFYDDDGRRLLHLGLGYLFQARSEGGDRLRYRTRPESHLTDVRLVDTGSIAAKNANLLNPEIAFVWGPFSLQGEYFWNKVDSTEANDPTFQGAYFFGSWFITGENRPYSTKGGTFSRIKPKRNFLDDGGFGAWELALRWSWIDLNDENIQGGEENNFTVGLNWYLNPNYRLMFNYVYADVKDRGPIEDADGNLILTEDGDANIFQMRFQVDF